MALPDEDCVPKPMFRPIYTVVSVGSDVILEQGSKQVPDHINPRVLSKEEKKRFDWIHAANKALKSFESMGKFDSMKTSTYKQYAMCFEPGMEYSLPKLRLNELIFLVILEPTMDGISFVTGKSLNKLKNEMFEINSHNVNLRELLNQSNQNEKRINNNSTHKHKHRHHHSHHHHGQMLQHRQNAESEFDFELKKCAFTYLTTIKNEFINHFATDFANILKFKNLFGHSTNNSSSSSTNTSSNVSSTASSSFEMINNNNNNNNNNNSNNSNGNGNGNSDRSNKENMLKPWKSKEIAYNLGNFNSFMYHQMRGHTEFNYEHSTFNKKDHREYFGSLATPLARNASNSSLFSASKSKSNLSNLEYDLNPDHILADTESYNHPKNVKIDNDNNNNNSNSNTNDTTHTNATHSSITPKDATSNSLESVVSIGGMPDTYNYNDPSATFFSPGSGDGTFGMDPSLMIASPVSVENGNNNNNSIFEIGPNSTNSTNMDQQQQAQSQQLPIVAEKEKYISIKFPNGTEVASSDEETENNGNNVDNEREMSTSSDSSSSSSGDSDSGSIVHPLDPSLNNNNNNTNNNYRNAINSSRVNRIITDMSQSDLNVSRSVVSLQSASSASSLMSMSSSRYDSSERWYGGGGSGDSTNNLLRTPNTRLPQIPKLNDDEKESFLKTYDYGSIYNRGGSSVRGGSSGDTSYLNDGISCLCGRKRTFIVAFLTFLIYLFVALFCGWGLNEC